MRRDAERQQGPPSSVSFPTTNSSSGWSQPRRSSSTCGFQLATGQLDNPARMREIREVGARFATVLREREIEQELDSIAGEEESEQ